MQQKFLFSLTLFGGFTQPEITPFLQKQRTATQLVVNGKPFLILGGESGNSAVSSKHYFSLPWEKHSESGWPEAGAILIELSEKEYSTRLTV